MNPKVNERARNFGSGLINIGCKPSQETFIGILAQNCIQVRNNLIIFLKIYI